MSTEFAIGEMTCVETAEDGSTAQLSMNDVAGHSVSLRLTLECLNQLIMTLPGVIRQAMQRKYRDSSLRVVYTAARFQVELADDLETRILTLETPDGFSVSFGLSERQCREIANDQRGERADGALVN